ncbi:MAG: chemotaxis protein CheR [Desulfobacteraceae bacterium]|nr:MAG: chemotaxis protein CheR [Desulfobacteraceae bacterium]
MDMTSGQFKKFCELVYSECGINLNDGKQQLLQARLSKRLRSTGIDSIAEYLKVLESDPHELVNFLDAISTNHTYFFRESHHFEHLMSDHLKIWCAASSSGEEPYSVAIHCLEKGFRPAIHASDISTRMLEIGQNGIYAIEKTKSMPNHLIKKYFQRGMGKWENHVRVKNEIMQMVSFQRYNLLSDPTMSREFDVIFCRNVFIYFDNVTRAQITNKLCGALKTSGYFIIGGAESLNTIDHPFKYIQPSIYRKV